MQPFSFIFAFWINLYHFSVTFSSGILIINAYFEYLLEFAYEAEVKVGKIVFENER